LLVTLGWLVTPTAVAVYDGVGQPDEPYRYVSTPQGAKAAVKKPAGASVSFPVVGGFNTQEQSLVTAESGPQASVFLPEGGLGASSGKISSRLVPRAPSDQPADGRIDGNVYRLSVTNPASPVTFTSGAAIEATIYLRATSARQPGPVIEHRSGQGKKWLPLTTKRMGNEIYLAFIHEPGEYAVVFRHAPPSGAAATDTGGGHQVLVVGLLGGVVLLLSVVLVVRRRSRQDAQ
jgi:hypothetical protein